MVGSLMRVHIFRVFISVTILALQLSANLAQINKTISEMPKTYRQVKTLYALGCSIKIIHITGD